MIQFTKKDAIGIVAKAAKDYRDILEGKNYLFIFRARETNKIAYFETAFRPRNFQHLTGIEMLDDKGKLERKPLLFYERCLAGKLSESIIQFRNDGTTQMKLEALPRIVNFVSSSKMTGIYNGIKPLLAVDRLAGTTSFCLGFTQDGDYYAPSSCLLEDIRDLTVKPSQVLAVMSKKSDEEIYKDIRHVAKGVPFNKLVLPGELGSIVDRSGFILKTEVGEE